MRMLLIGIGSMGDVQPMIILGKKLATRGYDVSLMSFSNFSDHVARAGLHFVAMPGNAEDFIGNVLKPGASPVTFLQRLEEVIAPVFPGMIEAIWAACNQTDAIITTFFGQTVYAFAQALSLPLFEVDYYMKDTTADACIAVMPQPKSNRGNRMTYRLAYTMIAALERRYAVPYCKRKGLPVRTMRGGPDYEIDGWTVPVLYAMSEHMVSRPPDWPRNLHITGFITGEPSVGFTPPPDLEAFLASGEKPVYVGFGSMTSGDTEYALQILRGVSAATGLRIVMATGWSHLPEDHTQDENLHLLHGFVPHDWLLPRMRAAVHHGGAGTTAATLRAGLPTLVVPFGGDQYFWGSRVHGLRCGPRAIPRHRLRLDRLAPAMEDLAGNPAYAQNAQALSVLLLAEDGATRAADIIDDALARWQALPRQAQA